MIFNVPAYQSFFSEFDRSVGHYKRYNKKDFINIEKKTNLKIEKLVYYDSIGFLFLVLNKIFSLKQTNLKNKIFLFVRFLGSVASNVMKNQFFYIYNKKDVQRSLFS